MADDDLPQPEKLPQYEPDARPDRQEPKQAKWPGVRKDKSK